jgi:hypothetical protein
LSGIAYILTHRWIRVKQTASGCGNLDTPLHNGMFVSFRNEQATLSPLSFVGEAAFLWLAEQIAYPS